MLLAQAEVVTPNVEWSMIWPLIILAIGAVLLVTITSLWRVTRTNAFPAWFTAACGIGAASFLPFMYRRVLADGPSSVIADALVIDAFTIFVTAVICAVVVLVALMFDGYVSREGLAGPEWYVLMLLSAAGGVLLAAADDLIVTFLGLEILSIAVYVLAALHLRRAASQEAGFKYFILGALSSAIFLYGIALIYGATGTTRISEIGGLLNRSNSAGLVPANDASMLLLGVAMLLVGFGFKVSAAPFHIWTPDVYEGSPSPVVAFMASGVKVAAFAGLLRVFVLGLGDLRDDWRPLLLAMAVLTLVLGSFLAVVQTNVKRMMAYSSIAHAGFMLVGTYVAGDGDPANALMGGSSVLFYLFAYSILVIGTFATVTVMGRRGDDAHNIDDYRGLARQQPVMAACLAILLFAQAGVPFTSGFFAKFRVIAAAAGSDAYFLAGVAMLSAAVSAFLYLRLVVAVYLAGGEGDDEPIASIDVDVPPVAMLVIGVATVTTVVFGILPGIGGNFLREAAFSLLG